jgi:osmotically-inducible protein OsmY
MAERWDYRDERGYRDRNERPMTDRAGDEVRSWFGDDEAARRRRMDEVRERSHWTDRDRGSWTDRDRDGRTGLAEFADNDRASYYSGYARPSYRDDYWTRERSYTPDTYPRTNYAGRGPRGYQRTDERIREDVCDCLTADPDIDASEIVVEVADGEVTLGGSVPDRRMKRDAEESVEDISGVRQVHNRLRVESKSDSERGTTGAGSSSEAGASEGQRSTASRRQGS